MGNPGAASHRTFSGTRKLGEKQLLEVNDVMARVKPSQVAQTIEVNNGWAVGLGFRRGGTLGASGSDDLPLEP
jgi:hypothetical protein